ncbi:hypothetical protein [Corallococcus sp. CA053C]|uniref:hypothetical protein n=1 Tax=Corallococcus sp. CA053C TaxID=2316732 RepID=UPI0011C4A7A9|nr:hypothetical protein [Corallococcus sp. CA053C]
MTLSPAELMRRALAGDWTRVDRELRRRGPDAVREALASVPGATAAQASEPVRVNGLTLPETVAALGLTLTDEGRGHVVTDGMGEVVRRGDAASLWCWLYDSGRLVPQEEDVRG